MIRTLGIISTNYRIGAKERLTESRPISAVPFGGRYRLLDFAMSNMVNAGIRTVGVVLPYNMRPLLDHIAAGKSWNLDRHSGGLFMLPAATPALKARTQMFCIKDILANIEFLTASDSDFVIITGSNNVANMDLGKIVDTHEKSGADITLVYKNGFQANSKVEAKLEMIETGQVCRIARTFDEEISDSQAVFADVFVFNRILLMNLVNTCTNTEFRDLLDVVGFNLEEYKVMGVEFKGYMKQIFTVSDYHQASLELLNPEVKKEIFDGEDKIITKIKDSPPTQYDDHAQVQHALISSGCRVDGEITNSIIFRNVTLKENCQVMNSVIMQNCVVGEYSILENVILDKGVKIPERTVLRAQGTTPIYVPKGTVI